MDQDKFEINGESTPLPVEEPMPITDAENAPLLYEDGVENASPLYEDGMDNTPISEDTPTPQGEEDGEATEDVLADELSEDTAPADDEPQKKSARAKSDEPNIRKVDGRYDFVELFVFTLVAVLIITSFFFRHSIVDGSSMEQTLSDGEHLVLSSFLYSPKPGDIIVCEDYSTGIKKPIVKRVIAVEGQRVDIFSASEVYVDGVPLDESDYVFMDYADVFYEYPMSFEVSEGHLFVLGDHRNDSSDSRAFGEISEKSVLGKVVLRIFPFDKFGTVD